MSCRLDWVLDVTRHTRPGVRPQAILDALKNPINVVKGVDLRGRAYEIFTGKNARVVVNPETGKIVSTNPLSAAGAHWVDHMKSEKRAIQLSRQEVTYLRDAKFLPATLARIIDNVSFTSNERGVVEVTDEIAEQFRAIFTDRLRISTDRLRQRRRGDDLGQGVDLGDPARRSWLCTSQERRPCEVSR